MCINAYKCPQMRPSYFGRIKAWAQAICIRPGGRLFFLMHSPQVTLHSLGCFPPVVHLHGSTKQSIKTYVPVSYFLCYMILRKKASIFSPFSVRIKTLYPADTHRMGKFRIIRKIDGCRTKNPRAALLAPFRVAVCAESRSYHKTV